MIRIIAEGVHDTAHSIFEAREILNTRPDAVFFELPDVPFQRILNAYSAGKLTVKGLKKELFRAIRKEEKEVDHELLKKFLVGEIESEELEVIETEGREIHVMQAAKEVKAQMYAMDMPLEQVEKLLLRKFKQEHINNMKITLNMNTPPFLVWELSEIFHYPYYFIERIMHHHAIKTTNPFLHNVNACKVCKLGTKWDRLVNSIVIPIFNAMPLSKELKRDIKIAYVIRNMDFHREQYMARKIARVYTDLEKRLGREPKIIAIVHLWNAVELERLLRGLE